MNQLANRSTARWHRPAALLFALLSLAAAGTVAGQGPAGVGVSVEFPEVGTLSVSATEVSFDLSGPDYPPAAFNAYYDPAEPDGPIELTVAANSSAWKLMASFTGFSDPQTNAVLGPEQLQYSIESSDWFSFETGSVVLDVPAPAAADTLAAPRTYSLKLRLVVTGDEIPGKYEGKLTFSLVSQ